MSGLICAGNVYLDLIESGVNTGFVGPINATKFSVTPGKADSLDRISYMRDTFGQALDSVIFPGVSSLSIETDDAAAEILQYALLGTLTDVTAASGAVLAASPEVIKVYTGKWTKLANRNVGSVVVKDADDNPTYTNGTHYTLDSVAGMIKFLSASGSPTDGQSVNVSYTYGALSSRQIIAATSTEVRATIRLDGTNLANQKKVEIICYEAVLVPSGELDMMGKKFISFGLSGTLITPTGMSGPFKLVEVD